MVSADLSERPRLARCARYSAMLERRRSAGDSMVPSFS